MWLLLWRWSQKWISQKIVNKHLLITKIIVVLKKLPSQIVPSWNVGINSIYYSMLWFSAKYIYNWGVLIISDMIMGMTITMGAMITMGTMIIMAGMTTTMTIMVGMGIITITMITMVGMGMTITITDMITIMMMIITAMDMMTITMTIMGRLLLMYQQNSTYLHLLFLVKFSWKKIEYFKSFANI